MSECSKYYEYALQMETQNDLEEALRYFARAAKCYSTENNIPKTILCFSKMGKIKERKNNSWAIYDYLKAVNYLIKNNEITHAISFLEKIISLCHKHSNHICLLESTSLFAWCNLILGKNSISEEVIEISKNFSDEYYEISQIYDVLLSLLQSNEKLEEDFHNLRNLLEQYNNHFLKTESTFDKNNISIWYDPKFINPLIETKLPNEVDIYKQFEISCKIKSVIHFDDLKFNLNYDDDTEIVSSEKSELSDSILLQWILKCNKIGKHDFELKLESKNPFFKEFSFSKQLDPILVTKNEIKNTGIVPTLSIMRSSTENIVLLSDGDSPVRYRENIRVEDSILSYAKRRVEKIATVIMANKLFGRSATEIQKKFPDISGNEETLQEFGGFLYNTLLVSETKERIRKISHDHMILQIDDELLSIPWELLYDDSDFLSLKFSVGRMIGTEERISTNSKPEKIKRIAIIGDPTENLQVARNEVLSLYQSMIQRCSGVEITKPILGKDVTIEKTLEILGDGHYDVVHYAGHAMFDPNEPLNSGWKLANGFLKAHEIRKIIANTPPKIIFANSCESAKENEWSGYGYSGRNVGIAGACVLGGTSGYIGAFWRVPDDSAALLASEFYRNILSGDTLGMSLTKAKRTLRNANPKDLSWASFVLYGDPTTRFFD